MHINTDVKYKNDKITWYVLSKLSYMNLVMREVFPTETNNSNLVRYIYKTVPNRNTK